MEGRRQIPYLRAILDDCLKDIGSVAGNGSRCSRYKNFPALTAVGSVTPQVSGARSFRRRRIPRAPDGPQAANRAEIALHRGLPRIRETPRGLSRPTMPCGHPRGGPPNAM